MSIGEYTLTQDLLAQTDVTAATGTGGCGCGTCGGSELVGLERTRFFARQLVGPDDLTQDQTYFRDKSRRHNRLLHGWGIACGARVKAGKRACEVVVEPGYVLGPYGDEIVIDGEITVDLCKEDPTGAAAAGCGSADPWCADVRVRRDTGQVMYLAVRYSECDTRPVRVAACGCGCDDTECEHSRTRDGFELKVLTELPAEYRLFDRVKNPALAELTLLLRALSCIGGPRACPPCPTSPWVILADVELDGAGAVTIDCTRHRRYVASFGAYFFTCTGEVRGLGLLGQLAKESALVDTTEYSQQLEEQAPPAATVAAKTGDGRWLTIPGTFEVQPGEKTLREVLAREGDRTLVDATSGQTMTLREVYAAAGADPATKVSSVADALAPLEGAKIDVAGLRVVRSAYDTLIDKHGLERLDQTHGGSPAAAGALPAHTLRGAETESVVGKHIAGKTVAEVAAVPQETFVAAATKGVKDAQLTTETERARQVWSAASRVAKLSSAWTT